MPSGLKVANDDRKLSNEVAQRAVADLVSGASNTPALYQLLQAIKQKAVSIRSKHQGSNGDLPWDQWHPDLQAHALDKLRAGRWKPDGGRFTGWLSTTAWRFFLDWQKKHGRCKPFENDKLDYIQQRRGASRGGCSFKQAYFRELLSWVQAQLPLLSPREAMVCRAILLGQSRAEIVESSGLAGSNVGAITHRLRQRLRQRLDHDPFL